mmetsp:Transcript_51815/g.121520  ORF Transcript_51815/g.121520 Transcript_51815/m.121520 type:complete len:116 (+) Transcript_51815:349-696(+)
MVVVDGRQLSQSTFAKTKAWVDACTEFNVDTGAIFLVVAKAEEEEDIPVELAEELAQTCKIGGPVFTSATSGMNVDRCFALCCQRFLERLGKPVPDIDDELPDTFHHQALTKPAR